MPEAFELVQVRGGAWGVRSLAYGEICHPGVGPRAEAQALYVDGLNLHQRLRATKGTFVVWDVGLGGGANALAVLAAAREFSGTFRIVSFDRSLAPLEFALNHAPTLGYFGEGTGIVQQLLQQGRVDVGWGQARLLWERVLGDFPELLATASNDAWPAPHAILFDPHSPVANPEMWTLPLLRGLFARCHPQQVCLLATYSRSTAVRVGLLLAGFFVGAGEGTGSKEETTVASNARDEVRLLLGWRWLERARRSSTAEPWSGPPYDRRPLSQETWQRLILHPQFAALTPGPLDSREHQSRSG